MQNCHFNKKKYVPVTAKQFNEVVKHIKSVGGTIFHEEYKKLFHNAIGWNGFMEDKIKVVELTCKYKGEYQTFVFDKTKGAIKDAISGCSAGMNAYACCRRMLGEEGNKLIPKIVSDEILDNYGKNILPFSTSPILYKNDKYENKENKAVGYDMNSAYSYAMLQDMPDTRCLTTCDIQLWNEGVVEEHQIGFDRKGNLVETGRFASFRFNRIPSPFKHFVDYYYKLKRDAKNPSERDRAKRVLNLAVGYFQRTNPFIRAAIVSGANNLILKLMDENTIYCNTDSIVSLKKRPELELGNEIGQWKIEHKGIFKFVGMNYQWNKELPAYRGVPKEWFPRGWDILKDDLPLNGNMYEVDEETNFVRRKKVWNLSSVSLEE